MLDASFGKVVINEIKKEHSMNIVGDVLSYVAKGAVSSLFFSTSSATGSQASKKEISLDFYSNDPVGSVIGIALIGAMGKSSVKFVVASNRLLPASPDQATEKHFGSISLRVFPSIMKKGIQAADRAWYSFNREQLAFFEKAIPHVQKMYPLGVTSEQDAIIKMLWSYVLLGINRMKVTYDQDDEVESNPSANPEESESTTPRRINKFQKMVTDFLKIPYEEVKEGMKEKRNESPPTADFDDSLSVTDFEGEGDEIVAVERRERKGSDSSSTSAPLLPVPSSTQSSTSSASIPPSSSLSSLSALRQSPLLPNSTSSASSAPSSLAQPLLPPSVSNHVVAARTCKEIWTLIEIQNVVKTLGDFKSRDPLIKEGAIQSINHQLNRNAQAYKDMVTDVVMDIFFLK